MKELTPEAIIDILDLEPLPDEGGYFRRTWHSEAGNAIYYLITPDSWSGFHLLESPELWHFYAGDPVKQLLLHPDGRSDTFLLGTDLNAGERPQTICPGHVWQSSRLAAGGDWALCGTSMAPPYTDSGYHHGKPDELIRMFPDIADLIKEFL